MVPETPFIADPDLVDPLVLARHDPLDHVFPTSFSFSARVESQIATNRTMRADRSRAVQFPRTSAESKISGREGAHGANIGRVSREVRVESRFRECDNFEPSAAIVKTDDRITDDFTLKTGTASALDTAFAIQENQITQGNMLVELDFFVIQEATFSRPGVHR